MGIINALIMLSGGSAFGTIFKKRYEEVLPISIMSIVLVLYLFYIFNLFNIGFYIVCGIIYALYGYTIYRFIKAHKQERKEMLSNFFTPGLLIFALFCFIVFILTRNNIVFLHDELRLWGMYPKALFYDGSIQLGNDALLWSTMQSYEPGLSLFQAFFAKCTGYFNQAHLYLSYAIVGVAVLLPLAKKITWKKWPLIPILALVFFLVPLTFANSQFDGLSYYYTLFIDPMLGIYFGYSLYLAFQNPIRDRFHYVSYILSLIVLVLWKDTGIVFAIFSIVSYIINEVVIDKNKEYHFNKKCLKNFIYLLLPCILIVSIFFSWKCVQTIYQTENMYRSNINETEVRQLFKNPSEKQRDILHKFKEKVLSAPLIVSNFPSLGPYLTAIPLCVFLAILFGVLILLKKDQERKKLFVGVCCFFVGGLVFTIGLLLVYLFSIKSVSSFERYVSTIFMAGFVFLFLVIASDFLIHQEKRENYKYFVITLIVASIFIFPFRLITQSYFTYHKGVYDTCMVYATKLKENIHKTNLRHIVFVFSDRALSNRQYFIYHHQIHINSIEEKVKYPDSLFVSKDEPNHMDFVNQLAKYDYAYFIAIKPDEDLDTLNLVLKEAIHESTLFKVENKNDQVYLEKVG